MRPPTSTARRAATGLRSALAEPILALAAVARRIPGPLRRPVGRVLLSATRTRGRTAPIRMLALDLVGRRGEALGLADDRAADAATRPAVRLALARASLALRSPAGAERLIRNLPDESANRPVSMTLRAEVALLRGRLTEARDLARQAVGLDPRAAGVADRAERELRALTPGWRPIVARRGRLGAAVPGRVVHLLTNSLPWVTAGYTLRSHEIGRAQLAAGLEPHLATRAGFPRAFGVRGAPAADEIDGVTYHRLAPDLEPASAPDQVAEATAVALAELVERLRPALLHPASNHLNGIAALAVGEAAGIPVVYEVRGFLEETWAAARDGDAQAADRYRLGREAETAVMAAAAAVVTLSESMRAEIVARGIPADRVVVVPNGVDIGRFAPRQPDQVLRSRLGLAEARPVVGYVSTLNAYEGVDLLVDAVARLAANGTAVSLLVVGDGPELPALRARAAALGLGGAAVFTGRVPAAEVPVYLSLLDLFVVPRRPDRVARLVTPLKPYEAMAMGCPLLVAGIEALTEIVGDGERGSTFPPGDARALAAAIAAILADPPPARARADEARAWVAAHRTWRRNAERYRELYARLGALGGGTGSSSGSGGGSPRRRTA